MKNYIAFVDDHSGSMDHLAKIALIDSNANMQAIADAASKEKLDTVVSQFALGYPNGNTVTRLLTISNPNVLRPAPTGPVINGRPVKFFLKRDDAREYARVNKLPKGSLGDFDRIGGIGSYAPGQGRWFVYTA